MFLVTKLHKHHVLIGKPLLVKNDAHIACKTDDVTINPDGKGPRPLQQYSHPVNPKTPNTRPRKTKLLEASSNYTALGPKYDMIKQNPDVFPIEKPTKLPPLRFMNHRIRINDVKAYQ